MRYAFVGTMIPKNMTSYIYNISEKNMQDAANVLQWHIYNGLSQNLKTDIKIINKLPVGSYPQYCKHAIIKKTHFSTDYCNDNINISFLNIKIIRRTSQTISIYNELLKWVKSDNDSKTIFVYTASPIFLKAVKKIKRKYREIKVCNIIADLPSFSNLSCKPGLIQKCLEKKLGENAEKYISICDYFVLLTKYMAEYLEITKPYCVIEGISSINEFEKLTIKPENEVSNEKIIFYSGTLHKRFGIELLLRAFKNIPNENYRLHICGVGDCEELIKHLSKEDPRIVYFGRLPRNEVLKKQKSCTVLINPRQNNEVFTKYSFPSKNMEYLSSGIPLIAYKLDGIPDEYSNYIFYVENDSVESLTNKIIEICEMPSLKRSEVGKKAQRFVAENKNEIMQTKKIIEMIEQD